MIWLFALACNPEMEPLQDAQNYDFTSTVSSEPQLIGPGDALLDWSGLSVDLLGRDMDPTTETDDLQIVRFIEGYDYDTVISAINSDDLKQSWVSGYVNYLPADGITEAMLSDFDFLGTPFDPDVEVYPGPLYMINAATEDVIGYRQLLFFTVDESETNDVLALDTAASDLTYSVDLQSAEMIPLKRSSTYRVNWTQLTESGRGGEIRLSDLDELMLGRYTLSLDEVEADFLNLDQIADQLFTADIAGLPEYELYDMVDQDGQPFEGFDKDSTWILALRCTTCINPAPPFLAIIDY